MLATLIVVYSLITWGGMLLFGRHEWLRRGEAFTRLFGYFARFAPTEVRSLDVEPCGTCDGDCRETPDDCVNCHECYELALPEDRQINLRPPAAGLARNGAVSLGELAFVVLVLSTVTFDGFTATGAWSDFRGAVQPRLSFLGDAAPEAVGTFGLLMFPIAFFVVYYCFCWAMGRLSGEAMRALEVCKMFLYSLIPIALAYHVAHFLVLLLIQGQTILPLASEPVRLGLGPVRPGRLHDLSAGHDQVRVVSLDNIHSCGTHHCRVPRACCGSPPVRFAHRRAAQPVSNAAASCSCTQPPVFGSSPSRLWRLRGRRRRRPSRQRARAHW